VNEYVTAAYGVVLFVLLIYVVVVGLRSARLAREAELLALLVERDEQGADPANEDPVLEPASLDGPRS
jgi:hypothetical protein